MLEEKSALDEAYRRRVTKTKGGGGFGKPLPTGDGNVSGFVILRTTKIKTLGNMSASLQHTFRERETPNADDARRTQNQVIIGPDNSLEVLDAWKANAPEKVRKNAVVGIEYLVTGSPDAMARMSRSEQDEYFAKSLNWLKTRHGAENILSAVIHRDETTPHLTAMVMPKDSRGKLNARHFLGGAAKLSEMQGDFAERVGKSHGLIRGVQGSKAKHQRVKSYYAALNRAETNTIQLPARQKGGTMGRGGESDEEYRQRITSTVDAVVRSATDRTHALIKELRTQANQDEALLRALKSERDLAREDAEHIEQMGTTIYAVERLLNAFEHETKPIEQEALATVAQAITSLKVKPADEIQKDISQRLMSLGYRETSDRRADQTDQHREKLEQAPPERGDPGRSR